MNPEQTRPRSMREMERKWKPKVACGLANDCNNACKRKPTATAKFFPLSGQRLVRRRRRRMQLRTVVGALELQVLHGQDPVDKHWGCPVRKHWGLNAHQQLSLALEDKLAFTITATASYAEAAAVAQKWGSPVSDSALPALAQRLGARAEAQTQARRRGLGKVARGYVVADGGVWIWNIVADRFAQATGVLDFYHASQHLWAVAHTLHPEDAAVARAWVEPLLHQLRHVGEAGGSKRCRICPFGAHSGGNGCPRRWRKKSTASRIIVRTCNTRRGRRKAVR